MNVFYCRDIKGKSLILDDQESLHAVKVLRMRAGEAALLMDGKGGLYDIIISNPHPKKCEVQIVSEKKLPPRQVKVHIAIAPVKLNDRMEWFLEKATEIGLDAITPVICSRSERKVVNAERYEKILIAAMKQSMNPWLPVLNPVVQLSGFLTSHPPGYIAHCGNTPRRQLRDIHGTDMRSTILIGPEGDFTPDEIRLAEDNGWKSVALGDSRLRTETAGIVAAVILNQMIHM